MIRIGEFVSRCWPNVNIHILRGNENKVHYMRRHYIYYKKNK